MMPATLDASSLRAAENDFARISPWLRCEPKMKSSASSSAAWPTAAASWPADRCAGPLWLYSIPCHPPVVLIEFSIDSNSRIAIMSCSIATRPSAPYRCNAWAKSCR